MISPGAARRLVRFAGDLEPGEPLYRSPLVDWEDFDPGAYWALRDDGSAYDWHPSARHPSPWT